MLFILNMECLLPPNPALWAGWRPLRAPLLLVVNFYPLNGELV